ncbi:acyl-CoA dehydrogenase family protein [Streptomyces sp. INA 01156]
MPSLMPAPVLEPEALIDLRLEVREFLGSQLAAGAFTPDVDNWLSGWDIEFTRALARRGWLGMTIPKEYGGHGRSFLERFVVTEELLAAGAPVAAHWIADRQVAPTLLRFGSETLKNTYLPRIAAGEVFFGIGMSEPDSGSDLASVRTRAERVDGGWRVHGTKLWTSGGHEADAFIALVRTSPPTAANGRATATPASASCWSSSRTRASRFGRSSRRTASTTSTRSSWTACTSPTTTSSASSAPAGAR